MADYTELTPTIVLRLRYAFLLDNAENVSDEMNRIAKLIDWDEYDGNATFNEVLQEYLDEGRGDIDDFSHWYNEIVKDDEDYDNDDCDDEDCDDPWNTCPNNHFGFGDEYCGWPDSRDYEDAENNNYYDNAEDFDIYVE